LRICHNLSFGKKCEKVEEGPMSLLSKRCDKLTHGIHAGFEVSFSYVIENEN